MSPRNNPRTPDERHEHVGEIMNRLSGSFQATDVNAVTAMISDIFGYVTFSERHALAYLFLSWAESRYAIPRQTQRQLDQIPVLDAKLDHLRLELDGYLDSLDEHVTQEDFGKALGKLRLIVTSDVIARPLQAEAELNEHRKEMRERQDPN